MISSYNSIIFSQGLSNNIADTKCTTDTQSIYYNQSTWIGYGNVVLDGVENNNFGVNTKPTFFGVGMMIRGGVLTYGLPMNAGTPFFVSKTSN